MACPYSPAALPALETRATRLGREVSEVGHGLGDVAVASGAPVVMRLPIRPRLKTVASAGQPVGGLFRKAGVHRRGDGV